MSDFNSKWIPKRNQSDTLWQNVSVQPLPCPEIVVEGADFDFNNISHEHVLEWAKNGIDVNIMFHHFNGYFKGKHYDSDIYLHRLIFLTSKQAVSSIAMYNRLKTYFRELGIDVCETLHGLRGVPYYYHFWGDKMNVGVTCEKLKIYK